MEIPTEYLNRIKKLNRRKCSQEMSLAFEICHDIKTPVQVPLKYINMKSYQKIYEIYSQLKKDNKLSKELFLWTVSRLPNKVGYRKLKQQKLFK
jgi:hypothetical protein